MKKLIIILLFIVLCSPLFAQTVYKDHIMSDGVHYCFLIDDVMGAFSPEANNIVFVLFKYGDKNQTQSSITLYFKDNKEARQFLQALAERMKTIFGGKG
jgi:hypothetical protein